MLSHALTNIILCYELFALPRVRKALRTWRAVALNRNLWTSILFLVLAPEL